MQLLHKKGANANAQGHCRNALHTTLKHGHVVMRLLLENRANVNALGRYYSKALQAASDHSYKAVM